MNLDQALQTFIAECRELLEGMESDLLAIGQAPLDNEVVNSIFRAAHTIKGSAGLFGLDHIVAFTHVVESVLDAVRDGALDIDEDLRSLLLACRDHIGTLVEAVANGETDPDAALIERGTPLTEQLWKRLEQVRPGSKPATAPAATHAGIDPTAASFQRITSGGSGADNWHISLRFGQGVLRNGMDPLSFLRYLKTLGRIVALVTVPDALPQPNDMDPECCYLGFEIAFASNADKAQIESVFEFVLDDCAVRILPPNSRITEYIELIHHLPEEPSMVGQILVQCGTLTAHELVAALAAQDHAAGGTPLGEILVEQGAVQAPVIEAALSKQKQVKEAKQQETQSVRVDAAKLDSLINLVGELIIAAASANVAARRIRDVDLQERHSVLSGLVEEVRDSALQLRMVKIGATFNRFQRVVHDVAREIGKDIVLAIDGEATELDKTVVEKLGDPLTHLVRNAIDHGIESPEVRAASGKPARGTVSLNAYHDSGSIIIEVSDDGSGLSRDRILAKAVERGLIEPGKSMTDSEVYALIFEPGFSTAEQVTNLSGRGVGMDVVKRNIAALRGSVDISSKPGLGTMVSVRLPLTLAIINGFQVMVNKSVFVVPLEMVDECLEFSAEPGKSFTDLRGEVLPFVRLRELFDIGGEPGPRENVVVVKHGNQKLGLVVDALLGESQTVIKPLSKMFNQVKGISGSSIRGTGDVALILDVLTLMQHASQTHQKKHHASASGLAQPA